MRKIEKILRRKYRLINQDGAFTAFLTSRKDETGCLGKAGRGCFKAKFGKRTGTLTIEGQHRDFTPAIKAAVFLMVADKQADIAEIHVQTCDDHGMVVRSGSTYFRNAGPCDKLDHIPFVSDALKREYGMAETVEQMKKRLL